jgi:cysteine desulfurase/selenocysteine lyase
MPKYRKVFFSYATVAPMSELAYKASRQFLDEFYMIGPPEVIYKYDPLIDELAVEAARLLNCQPEDVTYTKNTTEGITIASEALPLNPGDEVLILGNEYPANILPWLKKRQEGVTITVIDGTNSKLAYEKLLTAASSVTKVISISSCQYYDGFILDLARLSRFCRERNIFLVLDAVQTVGIRQIDLQKTPVDFLLCGGQKYLQAGMGIGFMYVNPDVLPVLRDTKVGIRSMMRFDDQSYTLKNSAARFQDGTQNLAGIVALHAALKRVNTLGIKNIEKQNLAYLKFVKATLKSHGIPFIDHGTHQGNIVSMRVPDPAAMTDYLKTRSVYIKPIKDVARLSFIHESRAEDIETLAKFTRQWLDGFTQSV